MNEFAAFLFDGGGVQDTINKLHARPFDITERRAGGESGLLPAIRLNNNLRPRQKRDVRWKPNPTSLKNI